MRRKRFTVTFVDGSKDVILAFTAEGACEYFKKCEGMAVSHVEAGDHRMRGGHVIDQDALAEAIAYHDLQWEVRIRYNGRQGETEATHSLIYPDRTRGRKIVQPLDRSGHGAEPVHDIMLKTYLTGERASRGLHHELAHAMQAERSARRAGAVTQHDIHQAWVRENSDDVRYGHDPLEVEAREHEALHETMPLARDASRSGCETPA